MADLTELRNSLILPDWPAPSRVRAVSTTRLGGVSPPPYDSLNPGDHVGDAPECVAANRRRLHDVLELPAEPFWLNQVHGNHVVAAEQNAAPVTADAAYTRQAGPVCVVMTADCLPILFCDRAGSCVAIAHGGWRGLAGDIIGATVKCMDCTSSEIMAWLGPAIGPPAFEVGPEVRQTFLELDPGNSACFQPSPAGRWLADIYELARRQLRSLGIDTIYGGGWCTFSESERFFSYRRDGRTGRMASLIWLAD
ncbi:MAG: peptidoglycan editing factor PgeF [Candidatus Competibacteraceae bacterium]